MSERRTNAAEGWATRMGVAPTREAIGDLGRAIAGSIPSSPTYIPRKVLSEEGERVLQLRYGSPDGFMRTQEQVGQILGFSRWAVGRIERKTIASLLKFIQQHSL